MTTATLATIVGEDDLQHHIEDDLATACNANSVAQTVCSTESAQVKHPTRWNPEKMRYEAYCCHHWWAHSYDLQKPGDYCHYGAHYIVLATGK